MATKIGALLISLGLDSAQFKSGLTQSERELQRSAKRIAKVGDDLKNFGAKMSIAVSAPLIALGKKAIDGFVEQKRAMADVEAALKSMGDASGKTAIELGKTADKLEMRSLFDAEVILKQVTAQLLTFGNIANREFDRAQQAAVDMAARLGGEPQSAAIMLGKALNDPVKGITALTRVGVQFTDQQKKQIKAMADAGRIAAAQGVILAEVERQFKGAAAAAADATPWRTSQVAIGQAMDVIGAAILPIIKPVGAAIANMATAFAALPEPMQKVAVYAGLIGAAFGPLTIGVGALISAWAPFIAIIGSIGAEGGVLIAARAALVGLGAGLGPLLAPLAALAAAGAVVYANWGKIAPVLSEVWASLQAALGPPLQELIATVSAALTELWNGPFGAAVMEVVSVIGDLQAILIETLGTVLSRVLPAAVQMLTGAFKIIADGVRLVAALLTGDWAGAWDAAVRIVTTMGDTVLRVMESLVPGVTMWLRDKLGAVLDWVSDKVRVVGDAFAWLYDVVVGHSYVPDMVDGIARHMARLDALMVQPAKKGAQATADAMRQMASEVSALFDRLFPASAALKQFREELELLKRAQASGTIDGATADAARKALEFEYMTAGKDRPEVVFPEIVPLDAGVDKVIDAIGKLGEKAKVVNVAIAKSFKDMATDTLASLNSLSSAIKGGGFLDILSAVIGLGLQLGSIGLFGKDVAAKINAPKVDLPGYANGTDFHPGGLAVVGERGPELVSLPRGSVVTPNGYAPGVRVEIVDTTGLFQTRVTEISSSVVTGAAAPLMEGGASIAASRMQRSQARRVA